eukprot:TRINITY_DN1018_c0_g1_i1.p1 TRINITY_DN1018_c0_g1~~TRINITY_DN1018_c0_g1_i1.p1  ORF type:complete len:235 (-),score=86.23 TRINITY_DN1018_c0_g1_i1:82-786(-)
MKMKLDCRNKRFAVEAGEAPLVKQLQLAPEFYGTETRDTPYGKLEYFVMQDVLSGFKHPSIIDIKMGTQTWHAECSEAKRKKHIEQDANCSTGKYGFRFCGMKVYNRHEKATIKFDKRFGWYSMDDVAMLGSLTAFFDDGVTVRADVIPAYLERMRQARSFLAAGGWQFFASSLLFAYDDVDAGAEAHPPVCYMIDFAHAVKLPDPAGADTGYCFGIVQLERFLHTIQQQHSKY